MSELTDLFSNRNNKKFVSLSDSTIPFGRTTNSTGTVVNPSKAKLSDKPMGNAPAAILNNFSTKRGKVDNLQFPLDVTANEGLGNHGHYIMFYINAVEDARLTTEQIDLDAKGSVADDPTQKYDVPKFLRKYDEVRNKVVTVENTNGRENVVDQYGRKLGSFDLPNVGSLDAAERGTETVIFHNKNSFGKEIVRKNLEEIKYLKNKNLKVLYIFSNPEEFTDLFQNYKLIFKVRGWHKNHNINVYEI